MATATAHPPSDIAALGRLGIVGAGRVGQAWIQASAAAGIPVAAVWSRTPSAHVTCPSLETLAARCDTVILTVRDDAIETVCSAIPWRAGQAAVHCSGATELSALRSASHHGVRLAGFHPLHTFGDVAAAVASLPGSAVAIETADASLEAALHAWARRMHLRPFRLPQGGRALYHASAHWAGSLVVTGLQEAVEQWGHLGVPPAQALEALLPLLRSTVRAIEARGLGPGMAGVVARGELATLEHHLEALAAFDPGALARYQAMSLRSVDLAFDSERISRIQAQALRAVLQAPRDPGRGASAGTRSGPPSSAPSSAASGTPSCNARQGPDAPAPVG